MSEKYKLGLTRNRLFEFDNCVIFAGRYDSPVDCDRGEKALKMLSLKEPVITTGIELEDDGEAYAVTDSVSQKIVVRKESLSEIIEDYNNCGLCFWEKLFEFSLSADGYFVIAGHTCVADAKALLRLAVYFSELYKTNAFSVNPSGVDLISEKTELPLEVLSPITDKLSLELESKWAEKPVVFDVEDYKKARIAYASGRSETGILKAELSADVIEKLCSFAKDNNVDASSVVGFAFYEKLCENTQGKSSVCKMNVYGDSRFFFENDYGIGAFNGVASAYLRKKEKRKELNERVKAFHISRYKGVTSTFKVLYDDVFMMSLSPGLCDSAYMYAAGCIKNKTSAKLAENYGCKCEKFCDYFSCNLDQAYWRELEHFSEVSVEEPFKMRSYSYLGFVVKNGKGYITFRYKKDKYNESLAKNISQDAINLIFEIIKN